MQPQEQINSYIAEQPEWQRRLLVKFRQLIHATDERIEEGWKANAPHFEFEGSLIGLHAFKTCVSVWFHKGALLKDAHGLFKLTEKDEERGVRKYKIHEGETVNEKAFLDLVKQALKLNVAGTKLPETKAERNTVVVPQDLEGCMKRDGEAWDQWEKFTLGRKKEYVEWIEDAKQEEIRKRRIAQALEMIRDGVGKEDKHKVN